MTLFGNIKAQWVKELKNGQGVDTLFRVLESSLRTKRDGSPYLTLTLMDRTGRIPAKIWQGAERAQEKIIPGKIHSVTGMVSDFRGSLEIRVDRIQTAPESLTEVREDDFMESATFNVDVAFNEMVSFIRERLHRPEMKKLLDVFVADHGKEFRRHFGARKIHHAWPGGLLNHTDSMVRLSASVADHYSLDRDILLMGALLHDLGKTREYRTEPALEDTLEGGLLGHIVISMEMFANLCAQVPDLPETVRLHIRHLIVSHHGEREYGSPEVPKTREAMALHAIDLLDSKLSIFREAQMGTRAEEGFTDYVHVIGRRLLVQKDSPPDHE